MDYWADFNDKTEIKKGLYWSAKLHSLNERYDDWYYVLTIYKKDNEDFIPKKRYGVVISDPLHTGSAYEKREKIFIALSNQAKIGKTNIPENVLWKGIGQDNIDSL